MLKSNFLKFKDNVFQLLVLVQNGSLHQKDTVHDNDFEPYLSGQSNQVSFCFVLFITYISFFITYISVLVLIEFCTAPVVLRF